MTNIHSVMREFEAMFDQTRQLSSLVMDGYPRFNLVATGEYTRRIELAVPGWNKDDIELTFHKGALVVQGTVKQTLPEGEKYLAQGLSMKPFRRVFPFGDSWHLSKAYMAKGLLCVDVYKEVPVEDTPLRIEIL